jgi:hypothetical protein
LAASLQDQGDVPLESPKALVWRQSAIRAIQLTVMFVNRHQVDSQFERTRLQSALDRL